VPEGPEVETIRRSLVDRVVGARLGEPWLSTKKLRTPIRPRDLRPLAGRRVVGLARHGKLLILDVEGGAGLFVRLGMTGRPRAPHTHLVWPLDQGARELRFVDARRFGEVVPFATPAARDAERARMGPDAITLDDAGRAQVLAGLAATKRALKDALLDQTLVAGVGNIYASEALFLARLSPFLRGSDLRGDEPARLLAAVEAVLADAVRRRGTSFSDYVDGEGREGEMAAHLAVFQRTGEACPACAAPIARVVQGARSTFLCTRCQPRRRRGRSS
jgi:formamidopyrimidine-DNA glycosylase